MYISRYCRSRIVFILVINFSTVGCSATSIISKADVAIPPQELVDLSSQYASASCLATTCRNEYIAMKMFAIDQNFADYKILLSRGDAYTNFGADIAQIGLAATGAVIPVSQTTKVLSAASAAVGLANTAANKDLILSQTMPIIEEEMTTLRASVKQTIIARMKCDPVRYPIGFVLSDLQAYADAGTITGALNSIAKSTATARATTNVTPGTATPTTTSTTAGSDPVEVATHNVSVVSTTPSGTNLFIPPPQTSKNVCPLS